MSLRAVEEAPEEPVLQKKVGVDELDRGVVQAGVDGLRFIITVCAFLRCILGSDHFLRDFILRGSTRPRPFKPSLPDGP